MPEHGLKRRAPQALNDSDRIDPRRIHPERHVQDLVRKGVHRPVRTLVRDRAQAEQEALAPAWDPGRRIWTPGGVAVILSHGRRVPAALAKRKTRLSMRDLGLIAGVSAMTVSKALRNLPKVAPETRRRILRMARAEGYRPDPELRNS